jgi:Neuraminidase (sialidase)
MALGFYPLDVHLLPISALSGGKMRSRFLEVIFAAIAAACISGSTPINAQNNGFAGRTALGSPPVAFKDQIFVGRAEPAQKVTLVAGGGHFPVACMLKNGAIAVVLRGGAPHVGIKGRLDLVTSRDGGQTWSRPRTIVDSPFDDRNPAFGQLSDGTLVLAYVVVKAGFDATGLRMTDGATDVIDGVYVIRSTDSGSTWTSPYKINITAANGFSPYGKIIQLADGTALMAIYVGPGKSGTGESYIYRSRDNGKTWGDPSRIAAGYNETGLVCLPDGRLLAALRADRGGHIEMAYSSDLGRTWSEPSLLTRDAEMPGDLIVLRDHTVVFTYGERERPCGVHALVSHDGGNTWDQNHLVIVADDAPTWDAGYPSSVELADGRILTVYYKTEAAYDPNLPTEVLAKTLLGAKAQGVIWRAPGP